MVIEMKINEELLDQLYDYAVESFNEQEIPVAAAILSSKDNSLVAIAANNRQGEHNVLGHAEINCILEAEKKINDWRLDGYYMIVSLEPCDMCSMVIRESRIDNVYYFLPNKKDKKMDILDNKIEIEGYEQVKEKFNKLLTGFFDNMR